MSRFQTHVELVRLPANREELQRFNDYLNVTYGARGWSLVNASLGVSANTVLLAFQRPVDGNLVARSNPVDPTAGAVFRVEALGEPSPPRDNT